ncbi:hypothetical protein L9F63_010295, partial [Diploptera punctata]
KAERDQIQNKIDIVISIIDLIKTDHMLRARSPGISECFMLLKVNALTFKALRLKRPINIIITKA